MSPNYQPMINNQYVNNEPKGKSYILIFSGQSVFLKDDRFEYLTYHNLKVYYDNINKTVPHCRYLFSIGEDDYFLAHISDAEMPDYTFQKLRGLFNKKSRLKLFAATTGLHLNDWYQSNRFCGVCGQPLTHSLEERALCCKDCGNTVYPKIAPSVMVGVTRGSKILLTKYAGREYKGSALVAGFTEIGETAEETVIREVKEEVGLTVKNVSYFTSQPWGFNSLLMLGFFAEVQAEEEIVLDEEELAEAEWIDASDIKYEPDQSMLMGQMLQHFRRRFMP